MGRFAVISVQVYRGVSKLPGPIRFAVGLLSVFAIAILLPVLIAMIIVFWEFGSAIITG